MWCFSIAATCSLLPRIASSPPCTFGCSVLTRPSIISGEPVSSTTSITLRPASVNAFAVPPVETSSTPRWASCDANAMSPALSDTDNRARLMRRGWLLMTHELAYQAGESVFANAVGLPGIHKHRIKAAIPAHVPGRVGSPAPPVGCDGSSSAPPPALPHDHKSRFAPCDADRPYQPGRRFPLARPHRP